ncbi:MAG: apolipoprotein N-acyltransferase [Moritella sp.]|uniref:apolipoprotein N-acyltransferase n=1 Tax=Moritella sp. TaxID=78556 RepID=UPI0029BE08C4|nr:apolipoprotein N-acyltransferase [Moritella sp.]MDX2321982.1 apolipoprotein N-acyltransferase [Moritella sp.]
MFAFAPFDYSISLYVSLFCLLFILDNKSAKHAAGYGFLWGLGFFIAGIHWVAVSILDFGGLPIPVAVLLVVLLCAYLAIYPALCAYLLNRFTSHSSLLRYFVAFPAMWLITDWLRGWVMTGFPWLQFGYSQMDNPLVSFAPILGVEGITLAVCLITASLYYAFRERKFVLPVIVVAIIVSSAMSLKGLQWTTPEAVKSIALVQGNTDQDEKWLPEKRADILNEYLTLSLDNTDADIIIWPESAIPALEFQIKSYLDYVAELMRETNTTLITGIINYQRVDDIDEYYNAVIVLGQPEQDANHSPVNDRYYKNKLLPIGEFVPFEDLLRPIAPLFNLPMSSFQRGGEEQLNLAASNVHIATAICYEIAFNQTLVKTVTPDTGFILTVSNDAWFGTSIGPNQHLEIARMRAFEFQRPVIRSTNTGITAIYDAQGQELGRIPQFEKAVLRAQVAPYQGTTPFNRYGNTPLLILAWLLFTSVLGHHFVSKKKAAKSQVKTSV